MVEYLAVKAKIEKLRGALKTTFEVFAWHTVWGIALGVCGAYR